MHAAGNGGISPYLENLSSGESFRLTPRIEAPGTKARVYAVAFSPDSQLLAIGTGDSPEVTQVEIYAISSRDCVAELPTSGNWVMDLAFSPDGRQLVVGTFDGTVEFWTDHAVDSHHVVHVSEDTVRVVAYSPDGTKIATNGGSYGGWGAELRILNAHAMSLITSRDFAKERSTFGVAWSPDGKRVFKPTRVKYGLQSFAAAGLNDMEKPFLFRHNSFVGALTWSSDHQKLIAGGLDGSLVVWDSVSNDIDWVSAGHASTILDAAVHPSNGRLFTVSQDGAVKCRDLQ